MLTSARMLGKIQGIEERYSGLRFQYIADIPMEFCDVEDYLVSEPMGAKWRKAKAGDLWGKAWTTRWFRGDFRIPSQCKGKRVFIRAQLGSHDTLFFVNGSPWGVFDGNHPVALLASKAAAGKSFHLDFEAYSGHPSPGSHPDSAPREMKPNSHVFHGVQAVVELEDVSSFVFDLRVLRLLEKVLDSNSLRKHEIIKCLERVFEIVDSIPQETGEQSWRPKIAQARRVMHPLLQCVNGSTMPWFGAIGHSHLDTAWHWPLQETRRKAARTFSSVLNLMEQYPEMLFVQNVPCHSDMVREDYPSLFKRMQKQAVDGRWEPNGPMWVEPDCNIPSGESLVRQLLFGQRANQEMFGCRSDTLWLPDVFGYSAALPQLLRGAGVEFFCTTKMAWNDTTRFPYDTFIWKGIDGSSVISHLNCMVGQITPEDLVHQWNWVQHKDVQDRRLAAFGFGDGGGGPISDTLEAIRRMDDLEGCPRVRHTTISSFMRGIRDELKGISVFSGELYLEAHRGTTTSLAKIKKGNRKLEYALRDAEIVSSIAALRGFKYPADALNAIWKELLTNQFHDILPGSSIQEVNDAAVESFLRCIFNAQSITRSAIDSLCGEQPSDNSAFLVVNTLGWDRRSEVTLENAPSGVISEDPALSVQLVKDIEDTPLLVVDGVSIPALGSKVVSFKKGKKIAQESPFTVRGNKVQTTHAVIRFDRVGRIVSLLDKPSGRELVKPGGALNTLWLGEDIPTVWDNWDIDWEQRLKMEKQTRLIQREIVACGAVQLRIRSVFDVGRQSRLTQDVVFHASSPRVDFETLLDWHDRHMLLKTGFELDLLADTARHEIQYGHVERPTHTNTPADRARFEVCAHKWTDISEPNFGVALLNDCKYGISVEGTEMRLTLLKSGTHPDPRGDRGTHRFTYSLLPHSKPFSVESVILPAYELNVAPLVVPVCAETKPFEPLLSVSPENVILETMKWSEDGKGLIVRLYEAGKSRIEARLRFSKKPHRVVETNLLEEPISDPLSIQGDTVHLMLKPFEVKTFLCLFR